MSNEKSSSWFKRHKVLTVVLGVVLLLFIVGALSNDNPSSSNPDKDDKSSQAKTYRFEDRADKQAKDVEVLANEPAMVSGVELTVTSVKYTSSLSEYETAANGKSYVIVDLMLENRSNETKPYNAYDFRIQTASGQVLDAAIVGSIANPLSYGDLVSKGKVSGQVVFEAPIEEAHQYIIWKSGISPDRAIVQAK